MSFGFFSTFSYQQPNECFLSSFTLFHKKYRIHLYFSQGPDADLIKDKGKGIIVNKQYNR